MDSRPDPLDCFRLDGKVAVVTGASSGIGRSMATALADAGASVHAIARREDRLVELAADVPRVTAWPADLTDEATAIQLVENIAHAEGRIDILVNSAGTSNIVKAVDEQTADVRRVLELNLVVPLILSREIARHMLRVGNAGSIVNVASIVGLVGLGRMPQAAYAASKAGLVNLTRELAAQWARSGIRVNAIAPAWFDTELTSELFATPEGLAWVDGLTPMGRAGHLEELNGALLLLASGAGSYMTGTVIAVDGGWTAV